jgi:hypothetical protein
MRPDDRNGVISLWATKFNQIIIGKIAYAITRLNRSIHLLWIDPVLSCDVTAIKKFVRLNKSLVVAGG